MSSTQVLNDVKTINDNEVESHSFEKPKQFAKKDFFESDDMKTRNEADYSGKLKILKSRLDEMEMKLENFESRTIKTYPNIKFLTYKDRKRIMVICCFSVTLELVRDR